MPRLGPGHVSMDAEARLSILKASGILDHVPMAGKSKTEHRLFAPLPRAYSLTSQVSRRAVWLDGETIAFGRYNPRRTETGEKDETKIGL